MANYCATARTNYVKVTDRDKLTAALAQLDLDIVDKDGRVAVLETSGEGWPSLAYDEKLDENVEIDVACLIAEHLAEGEVLVLIEAGAEKLRYVSGHAIAINNRGERRTVSLADIYKTAGELGDTVTEATY